MISTHVRRSIGEERYEVKVSRTVLKRGLVGDYHSYFNHLPPILVKSCSSVTISKRADRWFIAYKVDFTPVMVDHPLGRVGVDIGIKTLATLSKGESFPNLRPFRKYKRKLAQAQRSLSRKVLGSNNYKKAAKKVLN